MEAGNRVGVLELELTNIEPNPNQPRKHFDDDSLAELADSIKNFGVIQPLIVQQGEAGYYRIIAGERRWRAARIAGLSHLPAIVKDYTDADVLHVALIENIQRKDLNPIEEALCYKRLADEFRLTQEEIAQKVGKSRNSITYAMGLLGLDLRVQNHLIESRLTPGHARSIMTIKDNDEQHSLAEKIIEEGLTTRQTQDLVKAMKQEAQTAQKESAWTPRMPRESTAPKFAAVEGDLRTILGAGVSIIDGKKKGKIEIEYYSSDELERLIALFKKLR